MMQEPSSSKARLFLSVIMTALIVGGISFYAARSQIHDLETRLSQMNSLMSQSQLASSFSDLSHLRLPLIEYIGGGPSMATEAGMQERDELRKKVIDPYLDYANEDRIHVIAALVEIPENSGEPYQFTFLSATDESHGRHGFLFGKRGEELTYWRPNCMGPCEFSDSFSEKYPHIVNENAE